GAGRAASRQADEQRDAMLEAPPSGLALGRGQEALGALVVAEEPRVVPVDDEHRAIEDAALSQAPNERADRAVGPVDRLEIPPRPRPFELADVEPVRHPRDVE